MATQSFGSPAGRNPASASGVKGNVSVPSSKPSIGRNIEQPLVGKQKVNGGKAMGSGSLIPGKV
jgi:hypothetical protein